jgi:hypothetical protein
VSDWMLLARLEIPFSAEEGEANDMSRVLAAEIEAKVGTRVGVTTIRKWYWELVNRDPEAKSVGTGPAGWMPQGKTKRRRMGSGPAA